MSFYRELKVKSTPSTLPFLRIGRLFWEYRSKSCLSVLIFWRCVSQPWLHGLMLDLLDAIAMSSGITKFILRALVF